VSVRSDGEFGRLFPSDSVVLHERERFIGDSTGSDFEVEATARGGVNACAGRPPNGHS
jgi:hypothetical protein